MDNDLQPTPTFKHWIQAARLRTLPLAFATIFLGSGLAAFEHPSDFSWGIFALALLTAFSYQVLSNYANDLGDGIRGTDDGKKGEQRAVAAGIISISQMRRATNLFTFLSITSGTTLSFLAFSDKLSLALLFTVLGLLATWAARSYTLGANPYAYWGGGDLFVFIFFGFVGVVGSATLYGAPQHYFILPAIVVGALSAAVLTLNNLRDQEGDAQNGKQTLVVRYGQKWGRGYFKALLITAFATNLVLTITLVIKSQHGAPVAVHILTMLSVRFLFKRFVKAKSPEELDLLLKPTALVTLLYCSALAVVLALI
ncbi:MAG: 1,4-dihydroxy-2-naphthoate octaprenyltransferase [Bacteroidota bacterium]|jgi:1,4-dihydroxy-2-naphthoate octaprenyltransferase